MADSWILEGLVQFLTTPYWRHHIDSFIDYNCIVFDTEEENKLPHMDVYKNYQKHVEKILGEFSDNLGGITPEKIAAACSEGLSSNDEGIKSLFMPILAVSDFITFKQMMVARNLQLNEEAMKLSIKEDVHSTSDSEDSSSSESEVLQKALHQSQTDYKARLNQEEQELQEQMRLAMEESVKTYEQEKWKSLMDTTEHSELNPRPYQGLIPSAPPLEAILNEPLPRDTQQISPIPPATPTVSGTVASTTSQASTTTTTTSSGISGAEAAALWLATAKTEHGICYHKDDDDRRSEESQKNKEAQGEDLKQRSIYLRKQRDRLLAMKAQERERELKGSQTNYSKLPDPA